VSKRQRGENDIVKSRELEKAKKKRRRNLGWAKRKANPKSQKVPLPDE